MTWFSVDFIWHYLAPHAWLSCPKPDPAVTLHPGHSNSFISYKLSRVPFKILLRPFVSLHHTMGSIPVCEKHVGTVTLPRARRIARVLYIWHLFDGVSHVLIESTYIYNCFFTYIPIPPSMCTSIHAPSYTHNHQGNSLLTASSTPCSPYSVSSFLGRPDRQYGNIFGTNLFAKLWQEYAKADSRYAGIDLTTLSLEIITVFVAGPLAFYVAELIRHDPRLRARGKMSGRTCFWAMVLATGELYGGYV